MYFTKGILIVNAIFSIRFLYVQREGRIEIAYLADRMNRYLPLRQP
jgi:hypothetical protein